MGGRPKFKRSPELSGKSVPQILVYFLSDESRAFADYFDAVEAEISAVEGYMNAHADSKLRGYWQRLCQVRHGLILLFRMNRVALRHGKTVTLPRAYAHVELEGLDDEDEE